MSIPTELAAYLAGAIDSDGTIGVRRSTYAMRVTGDSRQPTFSERVCLKQVTPQIPELLREWFGGSLMVQAPSVTKGRPLFYWEATNRKAADALIAMLPFLRVKRRQAQLCLELRASKDLPRKDQRAYRAAVLSNARWGEVPIRRLEVSPDVLADRERLYLAIKALNRVGIGA